MSPARGILARSLLFWAVAVLVLSAGCRQEPPRRAAQGQPGPNPDASAGQPARRLEIAGVPNAWQVSDDVIRGGQPTRAGFENLRKMGVRTVVNLRSFHADRKLLRGLDLGYEHIYAKAYHPERHEVVRFLQIVTAAGRQPVFVHCLHGSDRTGVMVAAYRIAIQGWSKDRALAEMTDDRFGHHEEFEILRDFLRDLDFPAVMDDVTAYR